MEKFYLVMTLCALCVGCDAEKKGSTDSNSNRTTAFLERREKRRAAVREEVRPVAEVIATQAVEVAAVAPVTNSTLTRDAFRARLQTITGRPILSDEEMKTKAEAGDVEAQADLGKKAFQEGNMADGIKWATKAAEQGDVGSQYGMAVCYAKGYGVEKNPIEAAKWFSLAAAQGFADAQASLAKRYAEGDGVAQDKIEAYKWYDIADRNGRYHGTNPQDKLAETMTPIEIAEAQQRSKAFVANPRIPVK
jgi:TPR repeat protein